MRASEYLEFDAVGLRELISSGDVSVNEVTETADSFLAKTNPEFNFLSSESAAALASGNRERASIEPGPLSGVPFLMKEGSGVRGYAAVAACRMAQDLKSGDDGLFARLVRRAGLAILGTTNVPEFYSSGTTEPALHGAAINPWDKGRSAGGSSGGSAAAVALGAVPMAHGSDGGGSIRIPSHCCGVFGLVPTQARTPYAANSFGAPIEFTRQHVITRSVRDSAVMLEILARRDFSTPFGNENPESIHSRIARTPRRLRIAFTVDNPSGESVDPECAAAVASIAGYLSDCGHEVIETAPQYDWLPFTQAFMKNWFIFNLHAIHSIEKAIGSQASGDMIERAQLDAAAFAQRFAPIDIATNLHSIYSAAEQFSGFFLDVDVLLTPTCVIPAFHLGEVNRTGFAEDSEKWTNANIGALSPHLIIVNASGQPAISVPTHVTHEGLPVGVQAIARHNDETTLLQLATILESAFPWSPRLLALGKDVTERAEVTDAYKHRL